MNDIAEGHTLVIGASTGIGAKICNAFTRYGPVTALARRTELLKQLSQENQGISGISCDVKDIKNFEIKIKSAVEANGLVSRLFYCAGLQSIKPLRMTAAELIDELIRVNLTGAILAAKAFASSKVSEKDSLFCVISSIAGERPEPGILPYAAAKAGLNSLIHGLALELPSRRTAAIAPGWLDTDMTKSFSTIYNDQFKAKLEESSPRGLASIDDVVSLAHYLSSSASYNQTGKVYTVDGGASL